MILIRNVKFFIYSSCINILHSQIQFAKQQIIIINKILGRVDSLALGTLTEMKMKTIEV